MYALASLKVGQIIPRIFLRCQKMLWARLPNTHADDITQTCIFLTIKESLMRCMYDYIGMLFSTEHLPWNPKGMGSFPVHREQGFFLLHIQIFTGSCIAYIYIYMYACVCVQSSQCAIRMTITCLSEFFRSQIPGRCYCVNIWEGTQC